MNAEHRDHRDYLTDILEAAQKAIAFCRGMQFEEFVEDERTSFAVVRALEILGEAAKSLPTWVYEEYPSLPWREMAGMRDKLIHQYFGVNLEVVWTTVQERLPEVAEKVRSILDAEAERKEPPAVPPSAPQS